SPEPQSMPLSSNSVSDGPLCDCRSHGPGNHKKKCARGIFLTRKKLDAKSPSNTVTAGTELKCTCLQIRSGSERHSKFCACAVIDFVDNSTVAELPTLDEIQELRVLTVRVIPEIVCARVAVVFTRLLNDVVRVEPNALRDLVLFVK